VLRYLHRSSEKFGRTRYNPRVRERLEYAAAWLLLKLMICRRAHGGTPIVDEARTAAYGDGKLTLRISMVEQ
jgi:hypothetical protein